jgi:hypothetical protein
MQRSSQSVNQPNPNSARRDPVVRGRRRTSLIALHSQPANATGIRDAARVPTEIVGKVDEHIVANIAAAVTAAIPASRHLRAARRAARQAQATLGLYIGQRVERAIGSTCIPDIACIACRFAWLVRAGRTAQAGNRLRASSGLVATRARIAGPGIASARRRISLSSRLSALSGGRARGCIRRVWQQRDFDFGAVAAGNHECHENPAR